MVEFGGLHSHYSETLPNPAFVGEQHEFLSIKSAHQIRVRGYV